MKDVDELCHPDILIRQGVSCFTKYFKKVEQTFPLDWPKRGEKKATSLALTKMIAGFVKLLSTFINEGLTWNDIEGELRKIRDNVKTLQKLTKAGKLVFTLDHPDLPNAQPSASSDYRFLNENRKRPTSIQKVLPKK